MRLDISEFGNAHPLCEQESAAIANVSSHVKKNEGLNLSIIYKMYVTLTFIPLYKPILIEVFTGQFGAQYLTKSMQKGLAQRLPLSIPHIKEFFSFLLLQEVSHPYTFIPVINGMY